jgi:hypothetical protein
MEDARDSQEKDGRSSFNYFNWNRPILICDDIDDD